MQKLELTRELNILLNLTAISISSTPSSLVMPLDELNDVNWEEVAVEALAQSVPLAAFDSARHYKEKIDKRVYSKWQRLATQVLAGNLGVITAQSELISMLGEKGYAYQIIKGTAAGAYYPNPGIRALGDVDFLIDPLKKEEISELLCSEGYQKFNEAHPNHWCYSKVGAELEMHFEVAGVPYGKAGERVRAFLQGTVYDSQLKEQDGSEFLMPQPERHALILLLHMQHHMLGEGLGLRHLCDWVAFVNATYKDAFWQELNDFLKEIGLFKYAQVVTKTGARYLSSVLPEWAEQADDELADAVMADILKGGNFGRKDDNRSKSGMLISEHGKDGVKHGALYNLAHGLHVAVMRQHPIIKKVPIFYPFIYAYKAARFLFLSLIGKRPSLIKMAPEAQKRKSVYEKLEIFEINNQEK